jgi:hypothetical protein
LQGAIDHAACRSALIGVNASGDASAAARIAAGAGEWGLPATAL